MPEINKNATKNSIDNKSFALLRTNPKLTSNLKLLVNSTGDLFLSSFRANNELSKVEYQKYEIKSSGIYSIDAANFYGKLPLTQRYETLRASSDVTLFSDYEFQYEDQYQYGAIQNTTKLYDEQYKIFAPIWIEAQIPSKFVIYRVENVDYKNEYPEDTIGQNSRILELLKNATIIKTIDLDISSKIGEYLNTHINDKRFPKSLLTVNFKEDSQSTFNGIDIINGGFVSKAVQLNNNYVQVDYPEIFNNQTITDGFERNGIIAANLINLEFLFDDYTAENYKIYRYFGIYADTIDEGMFNSIRLEDTGKLSVDPDFYTTFYETNSNIEMFPKKEQFQVPTLQYVKDKSNIFYNIKNSFTDIINGKNVNSFLISTNNKDIKSFTGFAKNGKKITSELKSTNNKGFIKVVIKDVPNVNDKIFIGDRNEIKISQYNLGDYVIIADSTLTAGKANKNKFSNQGSLQQISIAISSAINNGEVLVYKTTVIDTSIIIEEIVAGNKRRQTIFGIFTSNLIDFIEVVDGESSDSLSNNINNPINNWTLWTTTAGSIEGQSILVKSSEIGNLTVGEYFKQKDSDKFVKIIEIKRDPFEFDYYRVILDRVVKLPNDRVYEVYEEYKTVHGKFAAYDFKDFDFDFYSTRNSELGDLIYDFNGLSDINAQSFYSGLRDILSVEALETVSKTQLLNEYDRLKENSLKETALLSRVVPTICKYELKNASNARNLPYFLNANEAFGDDNLSPNIEIDSKRSVEFLNMEHFHLNKIPTDILGERRDLNNYLDFADDGGLTVNKLKNTSFDFFDKHFNWTGYHDPVFTENGNSGKWINNTSKKLWTKFDIGNFEKNSSTVFRGLRYVFQKRKENVNAIPTEFLKGVDISDYKFGAYLNYVSNDSVSSNSIVFNCIKNEKFKFICIEILLNVVENNIAENELNRYLLYTLTDLKNEDNIIDTKILLSIDFANAVPGENPDEPFIINVSGENGRFTEFIKKDSSGEYSWIYFNVLGSRYAVKVVDVIDDSSILVSGHPYPFKSNLIPGEDPIDTDSDRNRLKPEEMSTVSETSDFYYLQGGSAEFANLLDSISAYRYSKRFNSFGQINYITVAENGTESINDFVLSVESGVNIIKPSIVVPNSDPERPKAYKTFSGSIGNIIENRKDGGYATVLRRMNGEYNPIFNSIITFSDINPENKIHPDPDLPASLSSFFVYNKLNGKGISFDSFKENTSNYGFISNYFYHKVNEQDSKNILKLSQTTDKLPLYPLIGEIAIDKKEVNVFKSKYSKDYFTRALSAGESETTNGTLSPVEKKVFLASTIMKVKDMYDITSFDNKKEASIEVLNKIRLAQSNTSSIHWIEDESTVIADFYLSTAILNELIEDGIERYFKKYVNVLNSYGDKTSLKDDLQLYSKSNISTRFIIDSIKIYGIESKSLETNFIEVTQTSQLTLDNFKELTNFNIQGYQNDSLSFRLIYNKISGYSYNFKIHVKIQA